MNTEPIEIVTSKRKFFKEYLLLKKPIIDSILTRINNKKTKISEKPMMVFAELLYYNDIYKNETEDRKWAMVFSRDVKVAIMDNLNIKEHVLNNYITYLRHIKILDGKSIRKMFIIYAEDRELSYKFRINGHQ